MTVFDKPLSNLQIELLQLYSQNVADADLQAIKRLLAKYFADQASDEMDKLWTSQNWSEKTMDEWLEGDKKQDDTHH